MGFFDGLVGGLFGSLSNQASSGQQVNAGTGAGNLLSSVGTDDASGMAGFINSFIPGLGTVAAPLANMAEGSTFNNPAVSMMGSVIGAMGSTLGASGTQLAVGPEVDPPVFVPLNLNIKAGEGKGGGQSVVMTPELNAQFNAMHAQFSGTPLSLGLNGSVPRETQSDLWDTNNTTNTDTNAFKWLLGVCVAVVAGVVWFFWPKKKGGRR